MKRPALKSAALFAALLAATPVSAAPDLAFGAYQRGDFASAMQEAKKRLAGNPKDAAALTLIGRLYAEGAGVQRDPKQALDWFRRAAELSDTQGLYLYGAGLLADSPGPRERASAKAVLEKAAAQNHAAALNLLGEMALSNADAPDFEKALGFFRRAAEGGDADAKYALGELYKHGKGVAKDDRAAAQWFRAAADNGHSAALVELAILTFNGAGVPRDPASAVKLFRRAAELGNPVAQDRLAWLLAQGRGAPQNLAEARDWRDRARLAGLKDAELDLFLGVSEAPKAAPRE